MESQDQIVYRNICNTLIKVAPLHARRVMAKFTVDSEQTENEGAVYDFKYDYVDQNGDQQWFDISGPDGHWTIGENFIRLREFFVSQGQPAWKSCAVSIDLTNNKYSVDFKYD